MEDVFIELLLKSLTQPLVNREQRINIAPKLEKYTPDSEFVQRIVFGESTKQHEILAIVETELRKMWRPVWNRLTNEYRVIDNCIIKSDMYCCFKGHRFRHFDSFHCPVCNSSRGERIVYALTAIHEGPKRVCKDYIGGHELDIVIPEKMLASSNRCRESSIVSCAQCRFVGDAV